MNCLFSPLLLPDNLLPKWPTLTMYKMCFYGTLTLLGNGKMFVSCYIESA